MTYVGNIIFANKHDRPPIFGESDEPIRSLSLASEDLYRMPPDIIEDISSDVYDLDISNNFFSRDFRFLASFCNLKSLKLDENMIDDVAKFPYMPNLETLSLEYNNIGSLFPFLKNLYESTPNLKNLSITGNDAIFNHMSDDSYDEIVQHRLYVLSWFPDLEYLNDLKVTEEERTAAKYVKREEGYFKAICRKCIDYLREKFFTTKTTDRNSEFWSSVHLRSYATQIDCSFCESQQMDSPL